MAYPEIDTVDPPRRGNLRRWGPGLAGVAVVALLVVAADRYAGQPAGPTGVAVGLGQPAGPTGVAVGLGQPARPFTLDNVRSGEPAVSLAALRGRPVVVNFWASWCAPCVREMPAFQAVHERLGHRIAFVGVNHKDRRASALDRLDDAGTRYPSGYDPGGGVAADFGLFGMPATLFIGPDGALVERRVGELRQDELEATLARLFPSWLAG